MDQQKNKTPRILVHVHIFYPDMWPEIKEYLRHIHGAKYDLYVTMTEENVAVIADILRFKYNAYLQRVPNKGYDIGPFISVLNQVDLADYDYIIKLHTKRDMPQGARLGMLNVSGQQWRQYLYSFLQDKETFSKCIETFTHDKTVGIITHHNLIFNYEPYEDFAKVSAQKILEKIGLDTQNFAFVAGTIFIARAAIFKPIKKMNLTFDDFETPDRNNIPSISHAFERLFGLLALSQGYKILDPYTPLRKRIISNIKIFACKCQRFAFQKKKTKNNIWIIKICKIPIWYS